MLGERQTRTTDNNTHTHADHSQHRPRLRNQQSHLATWLFESKGIDGYVTPHADANLTRTDWFIAQTRNCATSALLHRVPHCFAMNRHWIDVYESYFLFKYEIEPLQKLHKFYTTIYRTQLIVPYDTNILSWSYGRYQVTRMVNKSGPVWP